MKNTLSKRIPRDLKRNFVKYFGMVIILVCTISIGSSFQSTLNAAKAYLDEIVDGNHQEDGYFETASQISGDVVEHFAEEGIRVEENFYATDNEYGGDSKVLLFNERASMDTPTIFEGELPGDRTEIALDHVFARNRDIKVGDRIELLGKDYHITGTVALPDYSSLFMNNTDLVMNTKHFGVAVLSEEGFDDIEDKHYTYRYSYRYEDREMTLAQKASSSEDMIKYLVMNGATVSSFLRADQNQSISFLPMDIGSDGPMMTVFVYMLIALIAFIFAILTNGNIDKEAVIIGTLRASGYTKWEIILHYLQPTMIIAVVGSALGNILGYTVMLKPFADIYYTTYSVGPLKVEFDMYSFLITTVLPVVIMLSINLLMMLRKFRFSPLRFLRRDLKNGRSGRAVKLPDLSFIARFRMRVILQNRGCYIMLFAGIFLSSFLLMFGIGMKPLMLHYTDTIGDTLNYEYQYILKAPVEVASGEQVYVYEMDTWFELGGKDMGVVCFGIDADSAHFADAYVENGITISDSLSKKLKLKAGDTLTLDDDATGKTYEFDIRGVSSYNANMALFMDREALVELLDKKAGSFNSIIADEKLNIDESFIAKQISKSDVLGAAEQMMSSFGAVILFVNIFSVIVYIVMMYILTKVVIDKNALSISYMKVFGYCREEIGKIYLTASGIVVFLSLFLCIPLEIGLFKVVLVWLSAMIEGYVEIYLPFRVYAEIIVIGFVAYLVINGIHVLGLNRVLMTDALKNRE